jgi:hypothetical protein
VKEEGDGVHESRHSETQQALEEICAYPGAHVWSRTTACIFQVVFRPLLDKRGCECARKAERQAEEPERIDKDCRTGRAEGNFIGRRRGER